MKKFLFIYNATPERGSDTDEDWMAWFESIGQHLVDVGNPFQGGTLVKGDAVTNITSFAELVGGYSIINATDIDQAAGLAKSCPNAAGIRIFEAIPM
ncbi:MAG: hypothetical protein WCO95_06040 [Actinomycetes bacterium]